MIEGYIIDKLRQEKERVEREQWQPVPLPLEEYDPRKQEERPTKKQESPSRRGESVIELRLTGEINGYPTRV